MDYLRKPWVADEVLKQVKQLFSSRKSLYPDTKSKKHGESKSHDVPLLREDTINSGGELSFSRTKSIRTGPLQIIKWINYTYIEPLPNSDFEPRFIKGELCDKVSSIMCEFTPQCVAAFHTKPGCRITDESIGYIIELLDYDLIIQGSDGNLFWENYDYEEQCDPSKATKQRGKSSKPPPAHSKNPQVSEPVPIFRINKFKVLSITAKSQILCNLQPIDENHELKKLLTTLPRKPLMGKVQARDHTEPNKADPVSRTSSAISDCDSDTFKSQAGSPVKTRAQKESRQTQIDEGVSQMPFATQFYSRSPEQRFTNPLRKSPVPVNTYSEGKNNWNERMDDCAADLHHTLEALKNQSRSVKSTIIPLKAISAKAGRSVVAGQKGWGDDAPVIEEYPKQSRSSNLTSSTNKEHISSGEKKPGRKLGRPTKPIKMLPLGSVLRLHPGWQGMREVTKLDVTIPKSQLAILDTDAAWYPRVSHLNTARKAYARRDETIQPLPSHQRNSPATQSFAPLPLDDQTDQDSEFSWAPSAEHNSMPPDSSFQQSQDTPKNHRTRENNTIDDPIEITPSKKLKAHQKSRLTGSQSEYADPEIAEFSLTRRSAPKASISKKKSSSDQRTVPTQNTFTKITSSYEDPECGDFPVIKQVAKKTIVRKDVTTKAVYVKKPHKQPITSSYADPEIDEFSLNRPTQTDTAYSDSDTDGDTQLMRDPHGMTNVAKFGILRSQNLVYKKEQKRKRQERLSLGLPEEESVAEYHISEDEYNGYSSSEDKEEEERQRKEKGTTPSTTTEHSGVTKVSPDPISPVSGFSEVPEFHSEHDQMQEEAHLAVEPDCNEDQTEKPATMTDTNTSTSSRVMDNIETSAIQDSTRLEPKQDSPAEEIQIAPMPPAQQLAVRESPHKPKTKDLFVSKAPSDDDEDDDYIAQAIPKAFLTQKVTSGPVSIQSEQVLKLFQQSHDQKQKPHNAAGECNLQRSINASSNVGKSTNNTDKVIIVLDDDDDDDDDVAHQSLLDVPDTAKNNPIAPFPSTTPAKEAATIQVNDTPYPLTKKSAHSKLAYNQIQNNASSPGVQFDIDIIPATIRSPSSSKGFEVVIPIRKEAKRKIEEQPAMVVQTDRKKRHIRQLDFGNEEPKYKDLNEVAREHKRRYLESIQSSEKIKEATPTLYQRAELPAQNDSPKVPCSQETAPVAQATPLEENTSLSMRVGVPVPVQAPSVQSPSVQSPSVQPPLVRPKVPPVSSLKGASRRSSDSFDHIKGIKKKPPQKSESGTQKALKAIIAAKRASLSGSLPGQSSAMDISYGTASPASRRSSSSVSQSSKKVARPSSSSRISLRSEPSPPSSQPASRSFPANQSKSGSQKFVRNLLSSDDTDSDVGNIIAARPPQTQFKQVQRTLIPKLPTVPTPERPEKIMSYAGIQGLDIGLLVPGYNRLSTTKKERLNDQRKAYFGPGDLAMQSNEQINEEGKTRQKQIKEVKEMPQKRKFWWDEDNTPVRSYSKKLSAVKSVREELDEKDEGMTRVEVYRLSSGGMVRNVRKSL